MNATSCGLYSVTFQCSAAHFCGPIAITALTGIPIASVEDAVLAHRAATGSKRRRSRKAPTARVAAMGTSEISPVLERLGWRGRHVFQAIYRHERWTLLSLVPMLIKADLPFIVCVTGHAIAVRGRYFVDTWHTEPRLVARCPYLRKLVTNAIAIEPNPSAL